MREPNKIARYYNKAVPAKWLPVDSELFEQEFIIEDGRIVDVVKVGVEIEPEK